MDASKCVRYTLYMIVGTRTVWPIARHDASTEVGGGRAKTRAVLTGSRKLDHRNHVTDEQSQNSVPALLRVRGLSREWTAVYVCTHENIFRMIIIIIMAEMAVV